MNSNIEGVMTSKQYGYLYMTDYKIMWTKIIQIYESDKKEYYDENWKGNVWFNIECCK